MMAFKKCTAIFIAGTILANCATVPGEENDDVPWGWIVAGAAVIAVVAAVVAANNVDHVPPLYRCPPEGCISDERLKDDIHYIAALPNGLRLYSFSYLGDDRTFAGVLAQELLQDERFAHAVIEDKSGYYRVKLAALGLGIVGDAEQFIEAGQAAAVLARPELN